jgi:hypothetical protein
MTGKLVDRLVAAGVFALSFVVYLLTMAETLPFWDSGEFIAAVRYLEVMHPPGAPFYMLVGRFFAFFAPLFAGVTEEPIAFAVNLVSVLTSAATVLFTHLTIVRLVRVWKGPPVTWTWLDRLAANAGGAVGALAFAFSDSFWFNAVEAEVYAFSMFFTAAVVWLALVWREATLAEEAELRARGEHPFGLKADRYLLVIAYLFGLATGVHLLNLLAVFFVALVVFFTKFDREEWTAGQRTVRILAAGAAAAVAFFVVYPGVIQWLPSWAGASGVPTLFFLAVVAALAAAVWWTQKNGRPVANLAALAVTLVVVGYSTYGVIFVRAQADPPIELNDPETVEGFVSYLNREQYGQTPLLSGPNLGTGFREDVPFPRRWNYEPSHIEVYRRYDSDLSFFLQYQLGYMYWRYFAWNFIGRASDAEGSPFVWLPGETEGITYESASERMGRNLYFGLPLLLGLAGMGFHFMRDWRRALAVAALFLLTGVGIVLYLNQTPNQPRERDYSYVASFFAFTLWIGIGATGLVEAVEGALRGRRTGADGEADGEPDGEGGGEGAARGAGLAVAIAALAAVPGLLLLQNYDDHDRSGLRLPTDFAWNLLQSTAPNAILFTNGDNDTYPLWYLQEVMHVRPDVRVINLSLLNTDWYIRQLKNQWARESAPLPMSLTDQQVAQLQPLLEYTPRRFTLPTPDGGQLSWTLEGQPSPFGGEYRALFTSDLAVLDILTENARRGWPRPIYFSSTVAQTSELGLQPFFQNEGLARRVVPAETNAEGLDGRVDPVVMRERLAQFRFRNLTDPAVYYDENARGLADVYRRALGTVAATAALQGDTALARAALRPLREQMDPDIIPTSFFSTVVLGQAYGTVGDLDAMAEALRPAEDEAIARLRGGQTREAQNQAVQYLQIIRSAYLQAGAYEAAAAFYARLAEATGDSSMRLSAEEIRRDAAAAGALPPGRPPGGAVDTGAAGGPDTGRAGGPG